MSRRISFEPKNKIVIENVVGYFVKTVTPFGTGAKIDCPKEYLDQTVHVIILKKQNQKKIHD